MLKNQRKRAALVAIPAAILALSVGVFWWKNGGQGSPNASTILDTLVKDNPGMRYWLVVCSDAEPTAPTSALEAIEGHAWIEAIDTQTRTVTALGFYPADPSALSFSTPSVRGVFRDDSGRKFTVAHAYQINEPSYAQWVKYLAAQKKSTPTYNSLSCNCASWVVKSCQSVIDPRDVAKCNLKLIDPDAIIDQNEDINTFDPRDLAVFLQHPQQRTRTFVAGVNIQ